MFSGDCANAVAQTRMEQKLAKKTKVWESQKTFVNFVSFCSRFSEFWVIFISLTGSFSVWLSVQPWRSRRLVVKPHERRQLHIEPLLPDSFYGVQGKFLKIFEGWTTSAVGRIRPMAKMDTNRAP